jgi:hypothetical protein
MGGLGSVQTARQSSAHETEQAPVRRRQVSPSAFLDFEDTRPAPRGAWSARAARSCELSIEQAAAL